ncbi:MAG: hypothetical protein ACE5LB_11985 [Acidiferrobacterales bacterium]
MTYKPYCAVSGTLFSVVALAHLMRLMYGWHIQVDDLAVPMWVSWAGLFIPGLLAVWAFRVAFRAADTARLE